jgi:RNA polymerase sigma-70 factor (ECF subfamily)
MKSDREISMLLQRVRSGDRSAEIELLPLIYHDLRMMARSLMRNETRGHSLQATALVHEVLMKLLCGTAIEWQNRAHFFALASRQMRRILVDDQRQAQVVEMRFFAGMSIEEVAEALEITSRTVRRDWATARAWLYGELSAERPD